MPVLEKPQYFINEMPNWVELRFGTSDKNKRIDIGEHTKFVNEKHLISILTMILTDLDYMVMVK
jgi:hypothetical protein